MQQPNKYQLAIEAEQLINYLNQLFFEAAENKNIKQYCRLQNIIQKAHRRYERRFNEYFNFFNSKTIKNKQ